MIKQNRPETWLIPNKLSHCVAKTESYVVFRKKRLEIIPSAKQNTNSLQLILTTSKKSKNLARLFSIFLILKFITDSMIKYVISKTLHSTKTGRERETVRKRPPSCWI